MSNQPQPTELQSALANVAETALGKPENTGYGYIDFETEFIIDEDEERDDKAASIYVTYSIPLGELSDGERPYYITKSLLMGDGNIDTFFAHLVPKHINEAAELLIGELVSASDAIINLHESNGEHHE